MKTKEKRKAVDSAKNTTTKETQRFQEQDATGEEPCQVLGKDETPFRRVEVGKVTPHRPLSVTFLLRHKITGDLMKLDATCFRAGFNYATQCGFIAVDYCNTGKGGK